MTTEQQVSRGMYLAQSKAAEDFFEEDIVTLQAFAVQQEKAREACVKYSKHVESELFDTEAERDAALAVVAQVQKVIDGWDSTDDPVVILDRICDAMPDAAAPEQQVSKERFELIKGSAELNHYLNGFQADDLIAFAVQQEQARGRAEANARGLAEDVQAAKNRGDRLAEMVKEFEAERDRLRAQLDEIRKLHLHRAPRSDLCRECMREYPCPTLLSALDAAGCLEEK